MRDAFDGGFGDQKEFATPDGAVGAVTGAIPGYAERGQGDLVLREAGQDMRDVVLHAKEFWTGS